MGEPSRQALAGAPSALPLVKETARQIVGTQYFLAFMADVLWAARDKSRRSDVIKVVVDAAERFLEEVYMDPEERHKYMRQKHMRGGGEKESAQTEVRCVQEEAWK